MSLVRKTPLTEAATALAASVSPPPLLNHCYRTYDFGAALLSAAGRDFDPEILYVASILHDLGLTDSYDDRETPFEEQGASAAAGALRAAGAPEDFTGRVREAIALHLKASSADDPRPEVAGVSMGAAVDVLGLRLDLVPESLVAQTLEDYPRLGFKAFLTAAIDHQVRFKPGSRLAEYVTRYRFSELVSEAPFPD